ncbi:MAG: BamA/TamA family outer membrane protein [Limnothrix sp. RL_2_0]|nr:BamA/TamA family outer membrane protein [Limnothrix sp. RL_2_0]
MSPAQAKTNSFSTDARLDLFPTDELEISSQASEIKPVAQAAETQLASVVTDITPTTVAVAVEQISPSDDETVAIAPELPTVAVATVPGNNSLETAVAFEPTFEETAAIAEPPELAATPDQAIENTALVTAALTEGEAAVPPEVTQEQLVAQEGAPNEARVLVAEIQINGTGGNIELEQEVVQAIETRAGLPTTVTQIRNDVNRIYATGLFANVVATPEDTPLGVKVSYDVVPNPVLTQVTVQALPVDDNREITPPEVIEDIFGDRYGEIINLNDFQEGSGKLGQLERYYQDNGYDLAKVIGIDEPTADGRVTLVVVEGVIEDIRINFIDLDNEPVDGRTRDFIITREMELQPGDVFRRDVAQRDLQRVFGLGLFEDVQLEFTTGEEDPTKAILNLNVIEANSGSIAAGGGISSASGFFGTVSYQQQNVGGNNHRLNTEVQLGTREALFDVSFTDPWIANDPYRTSYTVNAFRRRSISLIFDGGDTDVDLLVSGDRPRVVRTGGGLTFSRPLSRDIFERSDWNASLGFQYQTIKITDGDGNTEFIDQAGNQLSFDDDGTDNIFALRFNIVRDKRDNPTAPTSGSVTRFGTDQTIPLGSNIVFNRVRASHSFYLDSPLKFPNFQKDSGKSHTLAFNIQGGSIIGDLPPYEAFSLGGSNSVRGYEEGNVGSGRHYLQATAEYRFPVFSVVGGTLFADYATDLGSGSDVPGDPAGTRGKPGSGFGYGIGVRVDSPLGNIRVDYGLNDQGDSRIHFGIGERF